jgi:hypothetical protein
MALPPNAFEWDQEMDPSDIVDYTINLSGEKGLLESGETITSYTLTLRPEATALGLEIISTGPRAPALVGGATGVMLWFQVLEAFWGNAAYSGSGVKLGIELTVETSSNPSRRRQRTVVLKVAQQ